jgi:G:T-mismatch repair DNA endonuclease (very short patch repair protein)
VRNLKTDKALAAMGWQVVTVWECETRGADSLEATNSGIDSQLRNQEK